jgi:hypothetical protein
VSPLLRLLSAWPDDPEAVRRLAASGDARGLVAEAGRHGLSGLVQHALATAGAALEPGPGEQLRRDALGVAAGAIKMKRLLGLSLDALAARGLRPVVLKGVPLAERLYGDAAYRASTDVDLWVRPAEVPAAEQALLGLGLRRGGTSAHQIELHGELGMVELHVHPGAPFGDILEGGPLRDRAVETSAGGRSCLRLAPDDELLYLAIHASNHLLQRLAWLYDLKLLARTEPALDWERLVRTAGDAGMAGLTFYALDACARLLGVRWPEEAVRALRPARWRAAAAARIFTGERLAAASLASHKAAWYVAKAVLAEKRWPLVRLAWHRLVRRVRGT